MCCSVRIKTENIYVSSFSSSTSSKSFQSHPLRPIACNTVNSHASNCKMLKTYNTMSILSLLQWHLFIPGGTASCLVPLQGGQRSGSATVQHSSSWQQSCELQRLFKYGIFNVFNPCYIFATVCPRQSKGQLCFRRLVSSSWTMSVPVAAEYLWSWLIQHSLLSLPIGGRHTLAFPGQCHVTSLRNDTILWWHTNSTCMLSEKMPLKHFSLLI